MSVSSSAGGWTRAPPRRAPPARPRETPAPRPERALTRRQPGEPTNAAGGVLADLQPQSLVLDLELRQLVLAHEIENLLQLLEVDNQCVIGI